MAKGRRAGRRWSDLVVDVFALLVIVLMLAIATQVVGNLFDVNPVLTFRESLPLFGDAVTLNSLLDLQWHLLAVIALLPAGIVWLRDTHVRVDFLYARLGPRGRSMIDLLGNLIFAAPFLAMSIPAGWSFAMRAWRSGEGSANGGLNDLWIVKMMLPVGLGLLALAVVLETVAILRGRVRP